MSFLARVLENRILRSLNPEMFAEFLRHLSTKKRGSLSTYEEVLFWGNLIRNPDYPNHLYIDQYHLFHFHPHLRYENEDDSPLDKQQPDGIKVRDLQVSNYFTWLSNGERQLFDFHDLVYYLFLFSQSIEAPSIKSKRLLNLAYLAGGVFSLREESMMIVDLSLMLYNHGDLLDAETLEKGFQELERLLNQGLHEYNPEIIEKINLKYDKSFPIGSGRPRMVDLYLANFPLHLRDIHVCKEEWTFPGLTPSSSINENNFITEPISSYLDFDRFDYFITEKDHYTYTRDEFPILLEKKNLLYNQDPLSARALIEIKGRLKLAKLLKLPSCLPREEIASFVPPKGLNIRVSEPSNRRAKNSSPFGRQMIDLRDVFSLLIFE